jgi:hypothetical protein
MSGFTRARASTYRPMIWPTDVQSVLFTLPPDRSGSSQQKSVAQRARFLDNFVGIIHFTALDWSAANRLPPVERPTESPASCRVFLFLALSFRFSWPISDGLLLVATPAAFDLLQARVSRSRQVVRNHLRGWGAGANWCRGDRCDRLAAWPGKLSDFQMFALRHSPPFPNHPVSG